MEFIAKSYIRRLFLLVFILFFLNKLLLRPFVLAQDFPFIFQLFVLSVPNFIEAVMGTIVLCGILTVIKYKLPVPFRNLNEKIIILIATIIASIYVITQELKIHNLGGRNVYDPYDLVASVLGLIFISAVLLIFGFANYQPAIDE